MNKETFIDEAMKEFDKLWVAPSNKSKPYKVIKSFIHKHLTQAFIKGVESVGFVEIGKGNMLGTHKHDCPHCLDKDCECLCRVCHPDLWNK